MKWNPSALLLLASAVFRKDFESAVVSQELYCAILIPWGRERLVRHGPPLLLRKAVNP